MKRIPRKLKKIAKRAIAYRTTNFYNMLHRYNNPKFGVVFIIPGNMKSNRNDRKIIKFGKKIREAYYIGLFD
jgi:hypothetical protein|nr:MAG: hypothetical protein [Bacteriophage sp.]